MLQIIERKVNMIYTGNYKNCSSSKLFVSISGDLGKKANFNGKYFKELAPKLSFWKTWHENVGKIPELDNMYYYIENYYNQVLKNLDIQSMLDVLGNDFILGCYEESDEFCHRQIVALYLEMILGINIEEVIIKNDKLIKIPRSEIYNIVKDILCKVIIEDISETKKSRDKQMILF